MSQACSATPDTANIHEALRTAGFRHDLARWRQLVTPRWLASLIAGRADAAAPAVPWRLFTVDDGAYPALVQGHIPGSGYLDTNWLEDGPFWNKVCDAALLRLLLELGIRHDTTVLLAGRHATAAGRAAHLLLYAGVRDVRLLDGGLDAWTAAGLPLVTGAAHRYAPARDFGTVFPGCPHYLVQTPQLKTLPLQAGAVLVSIRTWDEFTGKTSGYRYIAARGEIPGAVWGRAGEGRDMNSMSAFQEADGSMKPAYAIRDFWCREGIHPGLQTVFYCGTGWRASLAFFYAWMMGWENIAVYDGGWYEWSSDPANPVACNLDYLCTVVAEPDQAFA